MNSDSSDKRDEKASVFMRLVFENDRRIYAYIFIFVPNRAEADDLFQDTMSVMWEKFEDFKPGSDFGTWGIGIAHNLIRNYRRKMGRSRLFLEEDIEMLIANEVKHSVNTLDNRVEALHKCLSNLNTVDNSIIKLRYQEEIPVRNIAKKIGSTVKVVYTRLARANDLLLRCIRRTLAEQGV